MDFITPKKSKGDDREYRSILLPNKIRCILVHDATTERAAASMTVTVGHLQNPDYAPGLAHFLEHMLFLGTRKYPNETEYNDYLSQHDGCCNAVTMDENTFYYFNVTHEDLEGVVDRFSQFFIAPLFTESATEREMKAVDNEDGRNKTNDWWRISQVLKTTSNPEHPFSNFATGNLTTLRDIPKKEGIDIRKELLTFHENEYSANLMHLCILGKEPLDKLQELVIRYFSEIQDKNKPINKVPANPFDKESFKTVTKIVPLQDLRQIEMKWLLPSIWDEYKSKPTPAHNSFAQPRVLRASRIEPSLSCPNK